MKKVKLKRLVAMKEAPDSTGLGMFNVFCDIYSKYNLDWTTKLCAQSYDGAASMQGQYFGHRSYVQEKTQMLFMFGVLHIS
jgi:hypothetical protein